MVQTASVFSKNFCLQPKCPSSIGRCKKCGNHPQEDLAKSGYKTGYEVQNFIHPSVSLATHSKTKYKKLLCFPSLQNLQNQFIFKLSNSRFGEISPIKKKGCAGPVPPRIFFSFFGEISHKRLNTPWGSKQIPVKCVRCLRGSIAGLTKCW